MEAAPARPAARPMFPATEPVHFEQFWQPVWTLFAMAIPVPLRVWKF